MQRIIQDLTPPLIWRILRSLKPKPKYLEWEYLPDGWEAAKRDLKIKGWNIESILEVYKANWPIFLRNLEGTLPLGISPELGSEKRTNLLFHNIMMIYGYALALSTRQKSSISMLDWGGGIGHYFLITQKLIPDLAIDYHCKDVPVLAEYGKTLFPDAHFYTDETCLERKYDFILSSGSFQYSEDWTTAFKGLASAMKGYLLFTRLPTIGHVPSYVMVQRPYQYGYNTEYLGWCLNRTEFLKCAENLNLELIREFYTGEKPVIYNAPEQCEYWGFLFRTSRVKHD